MLNCPDCGKEVKNQGGLNLHIRGKHGSAGETPPPPPTPEPTGDVWTKPINLGIHARAGYSPVGRTIKMLVPSCAECENPARKTAGWWNTCPHNPYVAKSEVAENIPIVETIDGERLVTGHKSKLIYNEVPSSREVELNVRVNSGTSVDRWRRHGGIMPEEYRGEFAGKKATEGFAPFCQYQGCWSQDIKFKTDHGDFCRQEEAKLVSIEELEGVNGEKRLEVYDEAKRKRQLQAVRV